MSLAYECNKKKPVVKKCTLTGNRNLPTLTMPGFKNFSQSNGRLDLNGLNPNQQKHPSGQFRTQLAFISPLQKGPRLNENLTYDEIKMSQLIYFICALNPRSRSRSNFNRKKKSLFKELKACQKSSTFFFFFDDEYTGWALRSLYPIEYSFLIQHVTL